RHAATGAVATAEQLDAGGHDFGAVALLALLVLPLARADAAFHVDLPALLAVLADDLGGLAPHDHAVPLGLFLLLTVAVGPALGRREAQVGDGLAALRESHLRIGAEIANQDHLVHTHMSLSPEGVAKRLQIQSPEYRMPEGAETSAR